MVSAVRRSGCIPIGARPAIADTVSTQAPAALITMGASNCCDEVVTTQTPPFLCSEVTCWFATNFPPRWRNWRRNPCNKASTSMSPPLASRSALWI